MPIKVLQLNCNRSQGAHDMITKLSRKRKADVLLLSEPNKKRGGDGVYIMDNRRDTAIRILSNALTTRAKGKGNGFVWVDLGEVIIVSVYISPSLTMQDFERALDDLGDFVRTKPNRRLVIGGDFNAKATDWGNSHTDARGQELQSWAASRELPDLRERRFQVVH